MRILIFLLVTSLLGLTTKCQVPPQLPYPSEPPALVNIIAAEYFIDNDPGFGLATAIPITAAQDIPSLLAAISLTGVIPGVHVLHVRTKDVTGKWSITANKTFENFNPSYAAAPAALANITSAEYFIDNDPGFGLATSIPIIPANNISNLLVNVNLTGIGASGNKMFLIRSQDANGKWSLTNAAQFNNAIFIYPPSAPSLGNVIDMEYFFDNDPGVGNGTPISFTASQDLSNLVFSADISSLTPALHTFFIRSKQNPWSLTAAVQFDKSVPTPLKLLQFIGTIQNSNALLTWTTTNEVNTSHFVVERSTDGVNYTINGNVPALNLSNVNHSYNFNDRDLSEGVYYYRIKLVDLDGSFTYSPVLKLRIYKNGVIALLSNPVQNEVRLLNCNLGATIKVIDNLGRSILTEKWNGNNVNVSILPAGSYVLIISNSNQEQTTTIPFIKQ
jgi:hypothetical protein